ncbi:hypothetical protein [Cryptobacterium curtum]
MGNTTYNYNFPPYKIGKGMDLFDHVRKIKETAERIGSTSEHDLSIEQSAIECMGVIIACETFLRALPEGCASAAKHMEYVIIAGCGKWEEDAVEQATGQTPDADPLYPRPSMFWWSKKTPSPLVK